jgi:hypothetical protein
VIERLNELIHFVQVKPVKDRAAIKAAKGEQSKAEMLELQNMPPPPPPECPPPEYLKQYYMQCKACIATGYLFNPTTRVFAGKHIFYCFTSIYFMGDSF